MQVESASIYSCTVYRLFFSTRRKIAKETYQDPLQRAIRRPLTKIPWRQRKLVNLVVSRCVLDLFVGEILLSSVTKTKPAMLFTNCHNTTEKWKVQIAGQNSIRVVEAKFTRQQYVARLFFSKVVDTRVEALNGAKRMEQKLTMSRAVEHLCMKWDQW